MDKHVYRIGLFEITVDPTAEIAGAMEGFKAIADNGGSTDVVSHGVTREASGVTVAGTRIRGTFRKFRQKDLPEIGEVGGPSDPLELTEKQGLIEKNFFTFYKKHSLLAWHLNGNANSPLQFENFLSEIWETKVTLNPLMRLDALKRLLSGNVQLRSLEVSVPRPKTATFYPKRIFNKRLFDMLSGVDGDRIKVIVTTNATTNPDPTLSSKAKSALKELVGRGAATVARVNVLESGIEHPIDLIGDKLVSVQTIEHDGKYPPTQSMYDALDKARSDELETIRSILGDGGPGSIA